MVLPLQNAHLSFPGNVIMQWKCMGCDIIPCVREFNCGLNLAFGGDHCFPETDS